MRSDERRVALLSAFVLFAITAAFIILKSARDALFLSEYRAAILPYFMVLNTLVTAVASAGYLRMCRTLSPRTSVERGLKIFAIGTLFLWGGVKAEWGPATVLLYLWTGAFGTIAPVQAWSAITRCFPVRQVRRIVGIIGAGGIAGASAGGFAAGAVVRSSGVSGALPAATFFMLLGLLAYQSLATESEIPEPPAQADTSHPIPPRFALLALVTVGVASFVSNIVDFQFRVVAQGEIPGKEGLASFFASFYGYTGLATLLFQVFLTPLLMDRMPLWTALGMLPAGLALGNGLVIASPSLMSAITLRGSEQLLRHSVYRSSLEVLYTALPDQVKQRMKSRIETIGVRISETASALLLILLYSLAQMPLTFFAILNLVLISFVILTTILLGREYPKALKKALDQDSLNLSTMNARFLTSEFFNMLPQFFSGSKEAVLDLLDLCGRTRSAQVFSAVIPLLDHDDAEVRRKALQVLANQDGDHSVNVERLLSDPDRGVRVEAVRYIYSRSGADPLGDRSHILRDTSPTVRAVLFACLLDHETSSVRDLAAQRLHDLMTNASGEYGTRIRVELARALEFLGDSPSSNQLCHQLITDPSPEVQHAAMRSAGVRQQADCIPFLVRSLSSPASRPYAGRALVGYGEIVLPELRRTLQDRDATPQMKKAVLRILSDSGTKDASSLLVDVASEPDLLLKTEAIRLLAARKPESAEAVRNEMQAMLLREVMALKTEGRQRIQSTPRPGGLLEAVLNQRRAWALERLFGILALLYDPRSFRNLFRAFAAKDRRTSEAAVEFLHSTLSAADRALVLPVIESEKLPQNPIPEARKDVLMTYLRAKDELPSLAFLAELSHDEMTAWSSLLEGLLNQFADESPVIETWNWRCSMRDAQVKGMEKSTVVHRIQSLGAVDLFSEVGPQELLLAATFAEEVELQPGQVIYSEGDRADSVLALISGEAELRHGKHVLMVSSGGSLGTMSVLSHEPRHFTAKARTHCIFLRIDEQRFWDLVEDCPTISRNVFRSWAQIIRQCCS